VSALARVALLLALWLLAWGQVSTANVVSGVVVIGLLLVAFPDGRGAPSGAPVRPFAIARLAGYVVVNLVVANLVVARQILGRRSRVDSGVVDYAPECADDLVITLVANIIALSPGTMTVDVEREPARLSVHFLMLDDEDVARRSIARLEALVIAATGRDRTGARA
jgi:multicomponent Na+:H+ antiporter subunit E